jgi:hypothetical protein
MVCQLEGQGGECMAWILGEIQARYSRLRPRAIQLDRRGSRMLHCRKFSFYYGNET